MYLYDLVFMYLYYTIRLTPYYIDYTTIALNKNIAWKCVELYNN